MLFNLSERIIQFVALVIIPLSSASYTPAFFTDQRFLFCILLPVSFLF